MTKKFVKLSVTSIIIIFFASITINAEESSKAKTLIQAREIVQMLDDLYKTFIVLITEEYVKDPSVLPAATLSKRVFEAMSKKGWHKARLLDATGTPFNPDNNPKDKFERDAIKAMVSGKSYFERVEKIEGKNYLRAATAVPVVIKGCTICHPDKKVGDLLGAISYSIPLKKLDF
jgi:hypothetical protein